MFFIPTAKCSSGDAVLKNTKLSFFNERERERERERDRETDRDRETERERFEIIWNLQINRKNNLFFSYNF